MLTYISLAFSLSFLPFPSIFAAPLCYASSPPHSYLHALNSFSPASVTVSFVMKFITLSLSFSQTKRGPNVNQNHVFPTFPVYTQRGKSWLGLTPYHHHSRYYVFHTWTGRDHSPLSWYAASISSMHCTQPLYHLLIDTLKLSNHVRRPYQERCTGPNPKLEIMSVSTCLHIPLCKVMFDDITLTNSAQSHVVYDQP